MKERKEKKGKIIYKRKENLGRYWGEKAKRKKEEEKEELKNLRREIDIYKNILIRREAEGCRLKI